MNTNEQQITETTKSGFAKTYEKYRSLLIERCLSKAYPILFQYDRVFRCYRTHRAIIRCI